MKVQGACQCGRVSYEAEVDPARVSICHCDDCQVFSGSAYRVSVPAPRESFRLLSGKPKVYLKTAESGNKRAQSFCDNCGAPVYATDPVDAPPIYMLRVGGLKQKAQLPPKKRIWCRSMLEWSKDIGGLPGIDGQP